MIGAGVFLLPASLAPFGWNAVIGWCATIAGALVLAYILSHLTKSQPQAIDANGFVEAAFGEVPAFLIGWAYLVSIWAAVVALAVAAVSYLSNLVPLIETAPMLRTGCILALLWGITLINLRGVQAAGNFQIVTTILKIMPLIMVMILAFWRLADGSATVTPYKPADINASAIGGAAALTLFALLGFECASLAAARVEKPEINVPRATMWGTALTGVLYLVVCSAVSLMLPAAEAASSPAPLATFVERYWSSGPATVLIGFAVISCVGALNGWVLLQGELPRSMAAHGILPSWFAVSDARGTPVRTILLSSAVASVFVLLNASRTMHGLFEFLLLLSTSSSLWLYLACALAALRLKVVPTIAVIGAAYALWTLWGAGVEASSWSVVLMIAGLPLYWIARRARATS
jgi:APA family basic amino acid/polyamine antiporter